jgi:glycosyltransferase involved in cell wall biosynthesis
MSSPKYSIVVPVYNRPDEINELLESLACQSYHNFEVIVVEDGSQVRCDKIVDLYRDKLKIQYFFKPNSGPGPSRNFGFTQALGDYFIVFDSDCIIPSTYLASVEEALKVHHWDAWGGPDKAHPNFTILQRAMGYTMSSVLTTGGIRGAKRMVGKFQPRSFNMGLSRKVFEKTGGFKFTHFAEDIELSIRMHKDGFKVGLIPDAFVFHKRRTDFRQFYHQVFNFGRGRALVGRMHPREIKATHWFPSLFLVGTMALLILPLINTLLFAIGVALFFIYLLAIFIHAFIETHNLQVAFLSVPAALVQLGGYGIGFLSERLKFRE